MADLLASLNDFDLSDDVLAELSVHSPNLLALITHDVPPPTIAETRRRAREELADLLRRTPSHETGCVDGLRTPVCLYGRDYTGRDEAFVWLGPARDDGSGAVTTIQAQDYWARKLTYAIGRGLRSFDRCELCIDPVDKPHVDEHGTRRWRACPNLATRTVDQPGTKVPRRLRVCEEHFQREAQ